jgi:cytidine deaminase
MPSPSSSQRRRLESVARSQAQRAHAPYSRFRVGAAVLAASGKVYGGCNVENASYGLCLCAERTAVFSAIAAGEKAIAAVTVYTPTKRPTAPCGACRQVLHEFGPKALVTSVCDGRERLEAPLADLLPHAFGPADLA